MRLDYVELDNFCSYPYQRIKFSGGVNVLRGLSDAGKSNIIYAIQWGLFGVTPGKFSVIADMVRRGQRSMSVTIGLDDGTTITRSYNGSTRIVVDRDGILDGEYINTITNGDPKSVWSGIVGIPQFGMMTGFNMTPTSRKKYFNTVLGLNKYQDAWKAAGPISSALLGKIDGLKSSLVEVDTWQLDDLRSDLEDVRQKLAIMLEQYNKSVDMMGELVIVQSRVESLGQRIVRCQGVIDSGEKLSSLRSDIEKARKVANAKVTMMETYPHYVSYITAENSLAEINDAGLSDKLDDIEKEIEDITRRLAGLSVSGSKARTQAVIASIKASRAAKMTYLSEQVSKSKAALEMLATSDTCPVCGSEISQEHRQAETKNIDELIANVQTQMMAVSSGFSRRESEAKEKAEILNKRDTLRERLARFESEAKQIRERMTAINKLIAIMTENSTGYNQYIEAKDVAMSNVPDESTLNEEIVLLEKAVRDATSELAAATKDMTACIERQDVIEASLIDAPDNKEIDELRASEVMLMSKISSIETAIKSNEDTNKKIREMVRKHEKLSTIRRAIRGASAVIGRSIVERVSFEANKMFSAAWQRKNASLRWNPDFSISISMDDDDAGFTTGGGMQVSAALSIRLGIAVVSDIPIDFVIVDEPTMGAMDTDIANSIPNMITELGQRKQVIAVTHGDMFDGVASNIIYVTCENGISTTNSK